MAWTVPATAVSGQPFTAAIYNAHMRDNLGATAPALATTISSWFTGSGINQISERIPKQDNDAGSSTTTATSYGNLADGLSTAVTVATGTSAWCLLYCNMNNSGTNNTWMSVAVSGATTIAASDARSIMRDQTGGQRMGAAFYFNGLLTPGNNTFTLQYRVSAGTGTFSVRRLGVIPF